MSASKLIKLFYNAFGIKGVIINNVDIKEKSITFECILKKTLKIFHKICGTNLVH